MAEKQLTYPDVFAALGVEIKRDQDENVLATCPSCGKDKLYIRKRTGTYDCKVCSFSGNIPTFLGWTIENNAPTDEQLKELAAFRGIPSSAFRTVDIAYDGTQWLIPTYGPGKFPIDLRRFNADAFKGFRSLPLCKAGLFGFKDLASLRKSTRVWVCEGEWDWIALRWLLRKNGVEDCVVGVPGAGTFKEEWIPLFNDHDVILAYDHDQPGLRGSAKAYKKLREQGRTKSIQFIAWPDAAPNGFDINDWVSHGWKEHREEIKGGVYKNLLKLLSDEHPEGSLVETDEEDQTFDRGPKPEKIPTWNELVEMWSRFYDMHPDMIDALAVSCATVLSVDIPGDPLWLYLVAPPGGGKTTILNGMKHTPRCIFRSSLTPASLVSGFQSGKDPSLLPKLKGRTGVFKDGTEILTLPPNVRNEIYGVLRGAFDGDVSRTYGNNVERHYTDLHFSLLIGMTPAVHGENTSHLGERFLKFNMDARTTDTQQVGQIYKAVDQVLGRVSDDLEPLTQAMNDFLWQRIHIPPRISSEYVEKVIHMSRLIARLRQRVDREFYGEREVRVRPQAEVGTRLAKQLTKLALSIAFVYGKPEVDNEVWRLVARVAIDTTYGFHLDIISSLVQRGGRASKEEIVADLGIPGTTVSSRLMDLQVLQAVRREKPESAKTRGRPPNIYALADDIHLMWKKASFGVVEGQIGLELIPNREYERKQPRIKVRKRVTN